MSKHFTGFIEPIDVLHLRGNKLFGEAGSAGESLMPPSPSVVAGALRSRVLAEEGVDLALFSQGKFIHPELGSPAQPGSFRVCDFQVARYVDGQISPVFAVPSDLVISSSSHGELNVERLKPGTASLASSSGLTALPMLRQSARHKVQRGFWLTQAGWIQYLAGEAPRIEQVFPENDLWALDSRIGIGLNEDTRSAADHKLFTAQAVVLKPEVGFTVTVTGCTEPQPGLLRFGGDGRAAQFHPVQSPVDHTPYQALCAARRCRIVLTSPGVFAGGWRPTGVVHDAFELHGVRAKLVAACVPRAVVVSGWDLARKRPKAAQRSAPAGSVYWLEELDAEPEALRKLAEAGLWSETCEDASRRAEGFNNFVFAAY